MNFGEEIFDYVSNTYLVFRKLSKDFGYLFDYDNDITLNTILVNKIKWICESNLINDDIFNDIQTLKKFEEFEICSEYYYDKIKRGYILLFIEYGRNRILLNYVKDSEEFIPVESFYIPYDPYLEDFSMEVELFGQNYLIINTFDSFIKYSRDNGLDLHRDNNVPFFNTLINSLKIANIPIENGKIKRHTHSLHIYKYIVFDNIILITHYERETNEDDIPYRFLCKLIILKRYLLIYQIRDENVYVDALLDCRQEYKWLL